MPEGKDFFVSYTGADKKWAEWIAWILEETGYKTFIQAWDFNAASNFVLKMQSGTADAARTVAILTPDYFKSTFTQPEWAAAFADDPKSERGKLIAVRVADFEPPGVFKAIVYIDLVGLDETAAKEKLIKVVANIVAGQRLKPDSKPAFPGEKSSTVRPPFPGTPTGSKPFQHNLPFAPNPFFTGRDKMLDDLHATLQKKTAAAITQPQAVHGLGGVGKTQLAIEYAWKHQTDYDIALWASAASPGELHANIAVLAGFLKLPEAEAKEQDVKVKAVLEWLRTHQRWLLILDNADTKEMQATVKKLLLPGLHGHVIVTSRLVEWPIGFEDLEVSVLSEPASAGFLLHRSRKTGFDAGSKERALKIAKELGCLPLALEQAGAYVARHRVTFDEYLNRWKESRKILLGEASTGGTDYKDTVATTWLVTEHQLSPVARAILQLISFLAPQDIPRRIFSNIGELLSEVGIELMNNAQADFDKISQEGIEDALSELHDHSLIILDPVVISCHRLLQSVLIDRLDSATKNEWLCAALDLVGRAAKSTPPSQTTWPFWEQLRSSIESTLKHAKTIQAIPAVPFLMRELARYYEGIGVYSEAEPLMRMAVSARVTMPDERLDVLNYKLTLADLLCHLAKFEEAEKLSKEIVKASETETQIESSVVLKAFTLLARIEESRDHFSKAEALYKQIIKMVETGDTPDPVLLGGALNNLANLMSTTRRYSDAEQLFRRSLVVVEKHLNYYEQATIYGNLARCLHEQGNLGKQQSKLDEAESLYRRALEIDRSAVGNEHPLYARDANNLGWFLHDVGKFEEAEILLRQSLKIEESSKHENHPDIATTLSNLGRLLTSTRQFDEAKKIFERAKAITVSAFGKKHHKYATVQANLAHALIGSKEFDLAEACFKEALAIDEECFGTRNIEVAGDLWNLSGFLIDRKRYIEAEGFLRRALKIFESELGGNHIQTKNIRGAIEFARTARALDNLTNRRRKR
jgi:tetratricopeptide (TPR) repeat protein